MYPFIVKIKEKKNKRKIKSRKINKRKIEMLVSKHTIIPAKAQVNSVVLILQVLHQYSVIIPLDPPNLYSTTTDFYILFYNH